MAAALVGHLRPAAEAGAVVHPHPVVAGVVVVQRLAMAAVAVVQSPAAVVAEVVPTNLQRKSVLYLLPSNVIHVKSGVNHPIRTWQRRWRRWRRSTSRG